MKSKKWKGIVIHCSDSEFGDTSIINEWHESRGWQAQKSNISCGYHYIITNEQLRKDEYCFWANGQIEMGRGLDENGAHAYGYNNDYLGICLIGKKEFSVSQMVALEALVNWLKQRFNIDNENILGHYECANNGGKTCPNFDVKKWVQETF